MLRAFVGIPLPARPRAALVSACEAFVDAAPDWACDKWVAEENLHITLKFIGTFAKERLPQYVRGLERAAEDFDPFDIALGGIRAVPDQGRATMLWAGLRRGVEPCEGLARAVEASLEPLDVPAEHRVFKPHVTLVRARRPRPAPGSALAAAEGVLALSADPPGSPLIVSVPSFTLFSSVTGEGGPVYEEIARIPLAGK